MFVNSRINFRNCDILYIGKFYSKLFKLCVCNKYIEEKKLNIKKSIIVQVFYLYRV